MPQALYDTLDALSDALGSLGRMPAEWVDKMVHPIPDAPCVQREPWLLARCTGKRVMDLGCGWPLSPLHQALQRVCKELYGCDKEVPVHGAGARVWRKDLDVAIGELPALDIEVYLLGEVLEHLLNPGYVLQTLRRKFLTGSSAVIITVPNAFCPQSRLREGVELVNGDHVAWYSWQTLTTLVTKCGYTVQEWYWYHGKPYTAEGLIMVVR